MAFLVVFIVAAVVLPLVPHSHRDTAHSMCFYNEKQLGTALMTYVQDYDEKFPALNPSLNAPWGEGWGGQIYSYVKSPEVYHCPDDRTPAGAGVTPVSYAMNEDIARTGSYGAGSLGIGSNVSGLASPSKTVLLVEVQGSQANVADPLEGGVGSGPHSTETDGLGNVRNDASNGSSYHYGLLATGYPGRVNPAARGGRNEGFTSAFGVHHARSNFLLCDGHVKAFRPGQVSTGLPAAGGATPSTNPQGAGDPWRACGTGNKSFEATFSPF